MRYAVIPNWQANLHTVSRVQPKHKLFPSSIDTVKNAKFKEEIEFMEKAMMLIYYSFEMQIWNKHVLRPMWMSSDLKRRPTLFKTEAWVEKVKMKAKATPRLLVKEVGKCRECNGASSTTIDPTNHGQRLTNYSD